MSASSSRSTAAGTRPTPSARKPASGNASRCVEFGCTERSLKLGSGWQPEAVGSRGSSTTLRVASSSAAPNVARWIRLATRGRRLSRFFGNASHCVEFGCAERRRWIRQATRGRRLSGFFGNASRCVEFGCAERRTLDRSTRKDPGFFGNASRCVEFGCAERRPLDSPGVPAAPELQATRGRRPSGCRYPATAPRAVAQFGRAPVSKTGGWGFESLLPCSTLKPTATRLRAVPSWANR